MTARRVLVAGASGVVGRVLCRLLVADGWEVVGTTRHAGKADALRAVGATPAVVDVFDADALAACVAAARPEVVIHQLTDLPDRADPAVMPEALVRNARIREVGTRNLVDAAIAAGVPRVVAQSVAFLYLPGPMPFTEPSPMRSGAGEDALAVTARGVAELERQVLAGPFASVVLRYGRFYGPGAWSPTAPAGGAVHVDAAADAARRAATHGSGVFNIAEEDGTVSSERARTELGWSPAFRAD